MLYDYFKKQSIVLDLISVYFLVNKINMARFVLRTGTKEKVRKKENEKHNKEFVLLLVCLIEKVFAVGLSPFSRKSGRFSQSVVAASYLIGALVFHPSFTILIRFFVVHTILCANADPCRSPNDETPCDIRT